MGVPLYHRMVYVMENPNLKWMMGVPLFLEPPYFSANPFATYATYATSTSVRRWSSGPGLADTAVSPHFGKREQPEMK